MSTENTLDTQATGGTSVESTSSNVSTTNNQETSTAVDTKTAGSLPTEGKSSGVSTEGAPTYTPNFKYKAALQEKELDAFWHPLIKDADSEKKVKEIFTRADAFDYMKEKLQQRQSEFDSLQNDYQTKDQIINKVTSAIQKGDLESAFRNIGLNDHQIIQWAAKRVDYLQTLNQMPPEQRAAIERQQQAALLNEDYENQLSQMRNELQAQTVQAREVQLDMYLIKPELSQTVQFWDNKMGYNGAFRDMVVEEGKKAWAFENVDINTEQAVARVLQRFGKFIDVQGQQTSSNPNQTMPQQNVVNLQQKPVIPSIPGSAKAPIKKQVKSVADIKQRIKDLEAEDARSF